MPSKPRKHTRPPRIRVPNSERALFRVDDGRFIGIIQRLSLTGGSAILTQGPIPQGTEGTMSLQTVFGKVTAQIEFLQTGADGIPLAQAFRFVSMSDVSTERFRAAAKQMEREGFSDVRQRLEDRPVGELASEGLSKLRDSIRRLSGAITAHRRG
jgi:hypothetical protein